MGEDRDGRDGERSGTGKGRDGYDGERSGISEGREGREGERTGTGEGRDACEGERSGTWDGREGEPLADSERASGGGGGRSVSILSRSRGTAGASGLEMREAGGGGWPRSVELGMLLTVVGRSSKSPCENTAVPVSGASGARDGVMRGSTPDTLDERRV